MSGRRDATRDLLVMGASAGGIEALCRALTGAEPLDAAVLIAIHLAPGSRTALPEILTRATRMPARLAEEGTPLRRGTILIAPPDLHMLVDESSVHLSSGPRENRSRPAVDPLFRSAAHCHGVRTVAVVLSGMLNDGAAGLAAVRRAGGVGIVQDPDDARFRGMPATAIEIAGADHIVGIADMRATLERVIVERAVGQPEDEAPASALRAR
jgi:two-component system chemotaxis response regulator CheB